MRRNQLYYLVILIVLFSGCAQIGTLTGGDKDKVPPVLVKSLPVEKSLNFSGTEIILGFDEFVQLNNINSLFFSSPPLIEKPEFKLKRKNLVIELNEKLFDTTTYTFWFGDAIQDFHEGNPLKNFKFVFSTGNFIDTFEISGKVIDAYTLKNEPDIFVMLYRSYSDSVPLKEKPYYAVKTDTAGNFTIDFIKPGKYKIFALKDNDADFLFNLPNEKIAFLDSFIFPKVETKTIIDSLKAGSVLHSGNEETPGDTLIIDTVIIHEKYVYSPDNLRLFTFTEDRQKLYIVNTQRESAGKCLFEFSKPVDSLFVEGLNFKYRPENVIIEKSDSATKIVYWLKDETYRAIDTLKFQLSYFNKDSLDRFYKDIDTLSLIFNNATDTVKHYAEFTEFKTEHDSAFDYLITLKTPCQKINKESIKLFELSDTLVDDPRKQTLLKAYRPEPDLLHFELNRPYVEKFYMEPLNIDTTIDWCIETGLEGNKIKEYRLFNLNSINKDTIKAVIHYDNLFFRGQIQRFSDTLDFPLFKQGLVKLSRPEEDLLIISFKKKVNDETFVDLIDGNGILKYDKIIQPIEEELHLKLKNKDLIETDTLLIQIRTKDFDNTEGEKIFFEYEKQAVYIHKKQKLNHYQRKTKEEFILIFNKPMVENLTIKLIDFPGENNWFNKTTNSTGDTLKFTINNKDISIKDTLKINVNLNQESKSDTILLIYKKPSRHRPGIKRNQDNKTVSNLPPGMQKISIETDINFNILPDSTSQRNIKISYPWKSGKEYIIRTDSASFTDIFGDNSKKSELKFKVRTKDFFGNIIVNISNIKRISDKDFYEKKDSVNYDSIYYSKLDTGELILNLFDKDNKLVTQKFIKQDCILKFENLIPGDYSLTVIYDKNTNNKWDTGNYLKKIQPERVLIYPQKITIKSNWDNEIDLKITTPEY